MTKGKKIRSGRKRRKTHKPALQFNFNSVWFCVAALTLVTLLAMSPVLTADFVDIDDKKLILDREQMFLENPGRIFRLSFGTPHYKPMTYFTWMVEYRIAGARPFLYHFNNLLLHIFNTILVFFLTRSVAGRFESIKSHGVEIGFFTALLFGVHPMHVESVAWVVERKDVLFAFFYLVGLLGYIRYLDHGRLLPLAVSAIAYFLSVMSKAPGITMIAVLFLLDYVWQRRLSYKVLTEKAGHLAVLMFALHTFGVFSRKSGEGSIAAVMTEKQLTLSSNLKDHRSVYGKAVLASMRTVLWYLHSLFPIRLSLAYPREQIIGFFGPFIHVFPWILVVAAGALLRFRRSHPVLFFAHVFFVLTLAPAIIRLGLGLGIFMSDRYVYLPVFGIIFMVVAWVLTLHEKDVLSGRMKYGILYALVAVCAFLTFQQSRNWKNTETLWTNVIEKYPSVDYAWVNRGAWYREQGDFDRALSDLNTAIALDDAANARIQRGLVYRQMGNAGAALEDYNRALQLDPDNLQALTNRGNAYQDARRFHEAIADYERALAIEPRRVLTRLNLAIAYASTRNFVKALEHFDIAERDFPWHANVYLNRAIMYFETQRFAQAAEDYQQYLTLHPDDHQVHQDLGIVFMRMNRPADAVRALTAAINIHPVKEYYRVRADAYDALGDRDAAARDRQMAGR